MGARKKRKCEECGMKANMAYDPEGKLCADCLTSMKDEVLRSHRQGKLTYQEAEEKLMRRLRFSRFQVEAILFPPLGEGDFADPNMGLKLRFNAEASE
jgi:hypothetical protein